MEDYIKRLTEGRLPEIKDGVKVRSTLRTEDLRLIRKGFLALIISDEVAKLVNFKVNDSKKACELLKRMLRKVKNNE